MKKKLIIIFLILIGVLFLWLLILNKKSPEIPLNVVSTIPKNNAVFVNEKSEITLTLNRILSNEEGDNLKVEIQPLTETQIVYQGNKIRISPETEFNLNTNYEVKVNYKEGLIYTLKFETNPFSQAQVLDEGSKQTQADLDFNVVYQEFLTVYPWYRDIPIERNLYTIVYDFENEAFKIIMKQKIQNETERDSIVTLATEDIANIGVERPVNNYYLVEIE